MTNILSGAVDVTNALTAFTNWTGTPLYAGNCPDDSQIAIDGVLYHIASLTDTTSGTLSRSYAGITATGVTAEIDPYTADQISTGTLNRSVANWNRLLQDISGTGVQPNGIGDYASRSTYDAQVQGYVYLSMDGDGGSISTPVLFVKDSATSGDWSDAIPIEGIPGADGSVIYSGAGAPSSGTGANGDFYLNSSNGDYYLKSGGSWGSPAGNLKGPTGATGSTGATGATGAAGADGADGTDPGILLTWDTGTSDANPGSGKIRGNNASLASATVLYVSKTNRAASDISVYLAGLDGSTSPTKGQIVLTRSTDSVQATFDLTGITDATGYVKLAVSNPGGATSFTAADAISFQFAATGDAGAGTGDVVGPASAVDSNFASFDTTTGKLLKDSGKSAASFATAAQGALAGTAVQPGDLAAVAISGSASDLSTGTLPAARLPTPAASTLGGVKSLAATSHKFLTSIGTDGVPVAGQPAVADVTGAAPLASPTFTGTVSGITATMVGLGSVDNTSDATKNAATATLTNKRITPRIGTVTSSSTPTPTGDSADQYNVTALAAGATFAAPSGTPTDGQKLTIRIKDNGTAQTLAWNAIYRALGVTLPTTTVVSKTLYLGCIYNSADSKWDVVAVAQQA